MVLKVQTVASLHRQLPPMPSKTTADTLASFIRQQAADTLASILIELAEDHHAVHERLVRLQLSRQPKALAAAFRKKLAAWKRSPKYIDYSQVGDFGRDLEAWLGQVERELMPQDPAEALVLAEAFPGALPKLRRRAPTLHAALQASAALRSPAVG